MVGGPAAVELLYVGPDPGGKAVARLRSGVDSASVTVVDELAALERRLDSDVDCVVARHTLPDGSGFDGHELVQGADPSVPFVLLAEPTGDVAATAVERELSGFVPLSDGRPGECLVGTVERVLSEAQTDNEGRTRFADDTADVRWKADILDQLFERLPVHLYVKDANARHVLVSQVQFDDPSALLGQTDVDSQVVPPEEGRKAYEDDLTVIETEEPIIDREEYYPSSDEWYLTSKVPRYDEGGEVVGLIGVSREITERKKAQERLEALNERLEQFVSVVSHDLRNPLTVARGRVEYERAKRDSEHLETAESALTRMESLIDDLLTLAHADGDIQRNDRLQLSAVVRSCWADVPSDGATLTVESDLAFEGARGRVRQLLENLLRNSVEHDSADTADVSRAGVHVRVGALPDGDGFYVADDGPGIPDSRREDIFESGYTTRQSGTGFGLSIVEDVAQAHGWTVDAVTAESGGARFEITGLGAPE